MIAVLISTPPAEVHQIKPIRKGEPIKVNLNMNAPMSPSDRGWMDSDLSGLGQFEPYDFGSINPDSYGKPVRFVPGVGLVVGK